MTRRFWVSWYQDTADFRPLTDPPNPAVKGWWCSGYNAEDVPILCAVVDVDEDDPLDAVLDSWPEADFRFNDEQDVNWTPGDRFPMEDK